MGIPSGEPSDSPEDELRILDAELASLRQTAADLRRRIGERWDDPADPADRATLIEEAEEQEALVEELEARRERLLQESGRA
jgi:hypothetical protein